MAEKGLFDIELADGTQLNGLELNGNNFISKSEVTTETFRGKLRRVVISGDAEADMFGLVGEHENMELLRCEYDKGLGGWAFVLREIPAEELERLRLKSDMAYLAMMADVDLEK